MRFLSAQRSFVLALIMTLAVSLLPGRALLWTRPLREITTLVLTPFAIAGNSVAAWLRPARDTFNGIKIDPEYIKHMEEERVEYERLYIAEQTKVESLEEQLKQLQNAPADLPKYPVRPLLARIGLRPPSDAQGIVTLNRGSRDEVRPGTCGVYNHVYLLGRVANDVMAVQCAFLPLTNPATGPFKVAVLAKDRPKTAISLAEAPKLGLIPAGNGTFIDDRADQSSVITPGDEVVLIDSDWPPSAQGLKVGVVESVKPNDSKPLRDIVVVRPLYQVSQVKSIVLRIELDETELAGKDPSR